MKKIEANTHYDYEKLFDAVIDTKKLRSETIGKDKAGNLILHISGTYNIGSAYSEDDEYYILNTDEYRRYVEKARENKLISVFAVKKYLKEIDEKTAGGIINSFDKVTLHLSGMRYTTDLEIVMRGDEAEVTEYAIRYRSQNTERVPERSAVISAREALRILNDCKIVSWDGFHGAHPRGVLDGTMFSFKADVNGGRIINAEGSENFPKRFRELEDWFYNVLKEGEGQ